MEPIHDVEKFLSTFKVGDEFTVINSFKGKPHTVSTHKIRAIMSYDNPNNRLHGFWMVSLENDNFKDERFIADLVNNLHGCFVNPAHAFEEFRNRLTKGCDCSKSKIDYWDAYWDKSYDDYWLSYYD